MATSFNLFSRSIGGAVGVTIMGAILASGLGGSARLTPAALEGASLASLSPELRLRLIASLQRAFASGAVAAGLALFAAFWVPPFAGDVRPAAGEPLLATEMATGDPDTEPARVNDREVEEVR